MSVIVDDLGVPFSFLFTGGNESDMKLFERTVNACLIPLRRGTSMYADKGYDSRSNRVHCVQTCGLSDRIFRRRSINTRRTHAKRGVVERFFAWQDKQRRLLVRYEQKVTVYAAFMMLFSGRLLSNRIRMGVPACVISDLEVMA